VIFVVPKIAFASGLTVCLTCLALNVGLPVQASETPPPEYRTAMKDLEAAS